MRIKLRLQAEERKDMRWEDVKRFLWSHELFYAVVILIFVVVLGLLVYGQFFHG